MVDLWPLSPMLLIYKGETPWMMRYVSVILVTIVVCIKI
jgi:hypothetical protein